MYLYQLNIALDPESAEGGDLDEYFFSLRAAKARRSELIETGEPEEGGDWAIERIELVKLPLLQLAVAILNRAGYVASRFRVVPEYFAPDPPQGENPNDED